MRFHIALQLQLVEFALFAGIFRRFPDILARFPCGRRRELLRAAERAIEYSAALFRYAARRGSFCAQGITGQNRNLVGLRD